MAYAIMGGLAVATLLTLVFLPALYVTWFRIKRPEQDAGHNTNLEPAIRLGDLADGLVKAPRPELETIPQI